MKNLIKLSIVLSLILTISACSKSDNTQIPDDPKNLNEAAKPAVEEISKYHLICSFEIVSLVNDVTLNKKTRYLNNNTTVSDQTIKLLAENSFENTITATDKFETYVLTEQDKVKTLIQTTNYKREVLLTKVYVEIDENTEKETSVRETTLTAIDEQSLFTNKDGNKVKTKKIKTTEVNTYVYEGSVKKLIESTVNGKTTNYFEPIKYKETVVKNSDGTKTVVSELVAPYYAKESTLIESDKSTCRERKL